MTLLEALPELLGDIEGALVRLGRGGVAKDLRKSQLTGWSYDENAQVTYLYLAPAQTPSAVEDTLSLHDEIGVNLDFDRNGRIIGLEVYGYEQILSRLGKDMAV